jgi:hypothetical protein
MKPLSHRFVTTDIAAAVTALPASRHCLDRYKRPVSFALA